MEILDTSYDIITLENLFKTDEEMLTDLRNEFNILFDTCDLQYITIISDIFRNNNLTIAINDPIIYNLYGLYYENHNDMNNAIKYYLMAINGGNSNAMFNLGSYYDNIEKNYDEAIKYYLMAIKKGNSDAMSNLGLHYENVEKNYNKAIKYYLMAIEKDDVDAMYNLASYYQNHEKNYMLMEKYYLMAIEKGDVISMYNLAVYYEDVKKNYNKSIKYYLMAIEKGDDNSMNNLASYYHTYEKNYMLMEKYYLMAIELNNEDAFDNLKNFYDNDWLFYKLLLSLEHKSQIVLDEIKRLQRKIYYINLQVNTDANNVKECIICNENHMHLQFMCGHEVCVNCFKKMNNKCYARCNTESNLRYNR